MKDYSANYKSIVKKAQKSKLEEAFLQGLRFHGLAEPVREYKFHPERKWRVDFAWVEKRLFVEIQGAIWKRGGGGHSHPLGIERDNEKANAISMLGFYLLRFTEKEIKSGVAFDMVREFLTRHTLYMVVPDIKTPSIVLYPNTCTQITPCNTITV